MKLEDWSVVFTEGDYTAPELRIPRIRGKVSGNEKFKDGDYIITSGLAAMENENIVITESGSHYELGEPDPEYVKIYPDPAKRLFASYQKLKGEKHGEINPS